MTRRIVVDDHILVRLLLGEEPVALRPGGAEVFVTGLWYHRLCRSLANDTVVGVFSRQVTNANETVGAAAIASITDLPASIGLISLRQLGWPMARLLRDGVALNLLSLEALAAAEFLPAEICLAVADGNPALLAAARARGHTPRLLELG